MGIKSIIQKGGKTMSKFPWSRLLFLAMLPFVLALAACSDEESTDETSTNESDTTTEETSDDSTATEESEDSEAATEESEDESTEETD